VCTADQRDCDNGTAPFHNGKRRPPDVFVRFTSDLPCRGFSPACQVWV
jgi:hypothetical protein